MNPTNRSLPSHPVAWLLCGAATAVLLSGCGGGTYPVHGKVVFKGSQAAATELAGYMITLESKSGRVSASGVVEPDGTFELSTYKPGDGLVAGKHRVALNPPMPLQLVEGPGAKPAPPSPIPIKYGAFNTSGLEVAVERSGQEIVLEVDRAAP